MSAKRAKDADQNETPPPSLATSTPPAYRGSTQGYDFYLQGLYELQKSMGAVEATIKHLTDASKDHSQKIDTVNEQIHSAKGMAKAVLWILGIVGTIGLTLLGIILRVLLKHFNLE